MADRISEIREAIERNGHINYPDGLYLLAELDKRDQLLTLWRQVDELCRNDGDFVREHELRKQIADLEAAKSKEPSHEE